MGLQLPEGLAGGRHVVGMHEVEEAHADQLSRGVAENPLPLLVDPDELPLGVRDAEQFEGGGEEVLQFGGPLAPARSPCASVR